MMPGTPTSSPVSVLTSPGATPPIAASATAVMPSFAPTPTAPPPDPTTPPSTAPTSASTAATLPLKASAYEVGTGIQMAAGPAGGVYVSIPKDFRPVLSLLDADGKAKTGWPITLSGVESCGPLLVGADGSVRLLCDVLPVGDSLDSTTVRAFGFDATGQLLHGWPVDTDTVVASRMIGDALWLIVDVSNGKGCPPGRHTCSRSVRMGPSTRACRPRSRSAMTRGRSAPTASPTTRGTTTGRIPIWPT